MSRFAFISTLELHLGGQQASVLYDFGKEAFFPFLLKQDKWLRLAEWSRWLSFACMMQKA